MIRYVTGDILQAPAEAIVNTVNCVGVMGRGIALQFKNAYPDNFKAYEKACKAGEVQPGRMLVYPLPTGRNPKYIINFPTKRHWRGNSRMEDIDAGLAALRGTIEQHGIASIAIPPLGCGLGGLNWAEVRPRIEAVLEDAADLQVLIYEPSSAPQATKAQAAPAMTAGRAALVELVNRYLQGLLDPFVTLLEVHKLLYFLQEGGEPLRLQYQKAHYGPYAENLRHVLSRIEGHLISGYEDGGDAPEKQIALLPGAVDDSERFLSRHPETLSRIDRVAALIEGYETPFGLELLSTVHWVQAHEGAASIDDAVRMTHAWNTGKQKFTARQIANAGKTLVQKGWIVAL